MSSAGESFFTVVGCMDGRIQEAVARFGRDKFDADYPDTITEAGIVGIIANNPNPEFVENLKSKLLVSIERHYSKGIIVAGHQDCAGNPVDDERHKNDIRESVDFIRNLTDNKVPVVGLFIVREGSGWRTGEI